MIAFLLIGGFLLLAAPGLLSTPRGHPAHWARNFLVLQLVGFVLVEVGLLLWATPALLDLVGATDLAQVCRLMIGGVPGGWEAGAAAGIAALALATLAARGAWRIGAAQRRLRVESWLGVHHCHPDHELVLLPVSQPVAYTVGGRPPQVVLSKGLIEAIGPEDTEAVHAHEVVHARRAHHRFLLAVGAVEAAFGWYPLVTRGVRMLRLALERWADEEAGKVTVAGRVGVRRALLAVTMVQLGSELAGFGAAETVAERARALLKPPPRSRMAFVAAGYLAVWSVALAALGSLAWATGMSLQAAATPGLCVL
ncbi:MAG: M56 family metallopeptidase [Acidimicrobiia bacterium]